MVSVSATVFFPLVVALYLSRPALGPIPPRRATAALPKPGALCRTRPLDRYLGRPQLVVTRRSSSHVRLLWNAVPESDVQGYAVERSLDGGHWHELAYVPVAYPHRYRYDDTTSAAAYYRVVRLNFERQYTYSLPRLVRSSRYAGPIVAQPNPAHGAVRLLGRDPSQFVELINSTGQVVNQLSESSFSTNNLLPGVYALRQGDQITRLVVR